MWLSVKSGRSSKGSVNARSCFPLTRENLAKLKRKAVRRGCWFRDLKHSERKLLDLTIRVVEKVRSFLLAKVVSRLVNTLFEALESRIVRLIRTEGRVMAKRLSDVGQSLGCKSAKFWANNCGVMQFLVVCNLGAFGT